MSPRLINGDAATTMQLLGEVADQAEMLRQNYGDQIVLVIGNKLLLDSKVVFEEEQYADRIKH